MLVNVKCLSMAPIDFRITSGLKHCLYTNNNEILVKQYIHAIYLLRDFYLWKQCGIQTFTNLNISSTFNLIRLNNTDTMII